MALVRVLEAVEGFGILEDLLRLLLVQLVEGALQRKAGPLRGTAISWREVLVQGPELDELLSHT